HTPTIAPNPPPLLSTSRLPLHDSLPISGRHGGAAVNGLLEVGHKLRLVGGLDPQRLAAQFLGAGHDAQLRQVVEALVAEARLVRSEEHTSELQSRENLVCRLLLEKKNSK